MAPNLAPGKQGPSATIGGRRLGRPELNMACDSAAREVTPLGPLHRAVSTVSELVA